jgi:hypothetical protein
MGVRSGVDHGEFDQEASISRQAGSGDFLGATSSAVGKDERVDFTAINDEEKGSLRTTLTAPEHFGGRVEEGAGGQCGQNSGDNESCLESQGRPGLDDRFARHLAPEDEEVERDTVVNELAMGTRDERLDMGAGTVTESLTSSPTFSDSRLVQ